ncbi:hypothetical protein AB5J55_00340 [Streptomyces sp. R11]|uniref:Uncharacterized protein n=1 Tax=Streptomyces sp. R11 TaxID=3238625 RepID=A0AB39MTZ9_9ACTN
MRLLAADAGARPYPAAAVDDLHHRIPVRFVRLRDDLTPQEAPPVIA